MTAARRGEALALVWDNVLIAERHAFFPETKNGRPRKVPLRLELIEALESLPRTDERVFPITTEQLRDAWARICERAGIQDLHVHDCRHEAISRIAESGKFTLVDLQAISGHRDTRMLLRYAHLCVRQLAERLDEVFAAKDRSNHKGRRRLVKGDRIRLSELTQNVLVERAGTDTDPQGGVEWPENVVPLFGGSKST
jgi:integrase